MANDTKTFETIYQAWELKLGLILFCLLLLLVGNLLWNGIVQFEKYGADANKRSLSNILSGHAAICLCATLNTTVGSHFLRIIFGCLPSGLVQALFFGRRFFTAMFVAYAFEILTYKMLQVYAFTYASRLLDDFWATCLSATNVSLVGYFLSGWTMLDGYDFPLYHLMTCSHDATTGNPEEERSSKGNKFVSSMLVILFVLTTTVFLLTAVKKFIENRKDEVHQITIQSSTQENGPNPQPTFNNQAYNRALATTGQNLFVIVLLVIGGLCQIVIPMDQVLVNPWLTLPRHFALPLVNGVIVPLIFFCCNRNARKFLKDRFSF